MTRSPVRTLALRRWLWIRLAVTLLGVGVAPVLLSRHYALASADTDLHSAFKALVYAWHNVLLRLPYLAGALLLGLGAALVLPRLRGRAWWIAASFIAFLGLVGGWSSHRVLLPGAIALLLVNLAPRPPGHRCWRLLAWLPGSLLLLPWPVSRLAGLKASAAFRIAAGLVLACLWFGLDQALSYERYRYAVSRWPDDRLGTDVTLVEKVRHGDYHEYHDLDLVGDRFVVVAEQTHRLLSLDLDGRILDTWKLPEKWLPPLMGGVLDSASDPRRNLTWFLGGPFHVAGLEWVDGHWARPFRSPPISFEPGFAGRYLPEVRARGDGQILRRPAVPGLVHAYGAWAEEREELLVVTINPRLPVDYPLMIAARTPDLDSVRTVVLHTHGNLLLPSPRDIVWMPTLGKILIAPDFWDTLYLADPDTGLAEPFLTAPLSNGALLWSPEFDRLLLSIPSEMAVWVIDPYRRVVERRIRTQPGARPLALDAQNGLLLTASVLTGMVLVQRFEDGSVVDRFDAFMPMVRSLAVHPASGTAFLTTWSALYRFPYLRKLSGPPGS